MKRWRLSKAMFLADFWLVPIYWIAAAVYAGPSTHGFDVLMIFIGIGWGLWTLAEYWIHRVVYHRLFRREHWAHHLNPRAWIGVPPWVSGASLFIAWLFFTRFSLDIGTDLWVGFTAGYFQYSVVHTLIHHTETEQFATNRRLHDHHHLGDEVNFGVITSFWDEVFGTYHEV